VDEAHAVGLLGRDGAGLAQSLGLERHHQLFARVATYGKAFGASGAAILVRSDASIDYLLNYARPIVFSTAISPSAVAILHSSYLFMQSTEARANRARLEILSEFFDDTVKQVARISNEQQQLQWIPSMARGPIKSLLVPGNDRCVQVANVLRDAKFYVYPVRSPTVESGLERIRIVLHAYNTANQVSAFIHELQKAMAHTARLRSDAVCAATQAQRVSSKL